MMFVCQNIFYRALKLSGCEKNLLVSRGYFSSNFALMCPFNQGILNFYLKIVIFCTPEKIQGTTPLDQMKIRPGKYTPLSL